MIHRNWICISSRLRDIEPDTYWGHNTRYVIDHVTIRFPIWGFLLVLHWNQVPISKRFRDIWLQIYRGHDLDLLGSRAPYSISYRRSIVTDSLSPAVRLKVRLKKCKFISLYLFCIPVNYNKTANINVKKLQFNLVLTATCIEWHIKNTKNDKNVILLSITLTLRRCDDG